MGLPPLEYSDCFLDSPSFREIIALYEKELDQNATIVKGLVKECRHMIQATEEFSKVQLSFAQALGNFRFLTIGEQTGDEKIIASSLQTFARLLFSIEDCRHNMLSTISVRLLQTLERFRKDQIIKAKDEKKRFDKSSHSYYTALDRHLAASPRKKDMQLAEADSNIEREHAGFRQASFDYVCKLQDVHQQKQYELIEPIIGYISDVSTFLHQAYDSALSLKPELQEVQFKVQILRETFENEQIKAYQLKAQVIEEGEAGLVHHPDFLRQGLLYVHDSSKKVPLGGSWHRYFCQFRKTDIAGKKIRQLRLLPLRDHKGPIPTTEFMEVHDCIRCKTDEVDKRFCFEVNLVTSGGKYTMQATGNESRKGWLEIMEGKEPVYTSLKVIEVGIINDVGFDFLQRCFQTLESRGLEEEGLYRKPGIMSKANKLVKDAVEKNRTNSINFNDEFEWDTKTIASAVKGYLGKYLGEPVLTFRLHADLIEAAKVPRREERIQAIAELVDKLPDDNKKILVLIIEHLNKVASYSDRNLMKASNLGVVWGPTLMRPERESVASIVNIKYQNIIVEEMVDEVEKIFPGVQGVPKGEGPPQDPPPPLPTRDASKRNSIPQPPAHDPPPRPIPPLSGNPNIPPPSSITRHSSGAVAMATSKSPEPYEVPKPVEAVRRPPPGIPPGGSGNHPPVPRNKPGADFAAKRRTFIATGFGDTPSTSSNHKPVHRVDSSPGVKPSSNRRTTTEPTHRPLPTVAGGNSSRGGGGPSSRSNKSGKNARALYDCDAEDNLELSFKKDEILYNVTSSDEPDWMRANRADGKKGLVPANYVEMLP